MRTDALCVKLRGGSEMSIGGVTTNKNEEHNDYFALKNNTLNQETVEMEENMPKIHTWTMLTSIKPGHKKVLQEKDTYLLCEKS